MLTRVRGLKLRALLMALTVGFGRGRTCNGSEEMVSIRFWTAVPDGYAKIRVLFEVCHDDKGPR